MILFGEHAVVFGRPAFALAIDLRISASLAKSHEYRVNGRPMSKQHHAYISSALDHAWNGPPVEITTRSRVPSGSGLGSSAAITVSSIACMLAEKDRFAPETVARKAFEVEMDVQGRASPTDTSTSVNGHGVLVSPDELDGLLWKIEKGSRKWCVHHREIPGLTFVVGHTGIRASTGPLVARVKELVESSPAAMEAIDRISEIVMSGVEAAEGRDKKKLGALMSENHELLNSLGVGHPMLDDLVKACSGASYGAKMTGAGGGGSMIALTDDPDSAAEAILAAGGKPIVVTVGCEGVRLEG
jgi:mevalonate kinase